MKFYVASNIPHDYPHKLQKPATASERIRETAESFILDSGIGDETTNADVLDLAHELQADYVIPCDELHDQDATTAAVDEFLELYQTHGCDAIPMIPLQPPHAEHYRDLRGHSHYCLGGMAVDDVTDKQAIRWMRELRRVAGDGPHVHGLGVGGGKTIIRSLAGDGIVDSVDAATPEMAAINGSVIEDTGRQEQVLIHSGEGYRKRTAPLSELNCWQIQDMWAAQADTAQQSLTEATK